MSCIKCKRPIEGFCTKCVTEMGAAGIRFLAPYSILKPWIYGHKIDFSCKSELIEPRLLESFFGSLEKKIQSPFTVELVPSRDEQNWIQNILPDSIRNLIRGSNLIRAEDQIEQKYLNWEERHSRRYNLFEVRSNASILSDSVMLVDDVMSTGTSLESCVSLLLRLGYRRVYIVVFAYQSRISEEKYGSK